MKRMIHLTKEEASCISEIAYKYERESAFPLGIFVIMLQQTFFSNKGLLRTNETDLTRGETSQLDFEFRNLIGKHLIPLANCDAHSRATEMTIFTVIQL